MKPFAQVFDGEMFVTYADDETSARAAFTHDARLPVFDDDDTPARVREQPSRKASEFIYTHRDRGNVPATIVGEVPPDFRDYDPADVSITVGGVEAGAPVDGGFASVDSEDEAPNVLNA